MTLLIGTGAVTVADAGYLISGYADSLVFAIARFAGETVALVPGIWPCELL